MIMILIAVACVAFGLFLWLELIISLAGKGSAVTGALSGAVIFAIMAGIGAGLLFGYPTYRVWEQGKQGEAALAKATQDRQIKVQEAEAEMEAASKQAEANKILGQSVREYPEAMEQKWVEAIEKTQNQVIYLPTEASVPVTESSRMAVKKQEEK